MASPIRSRRYFAMSSSVKEAHDLMNEASRKISEASSKASAEEAVELKRHSLELYDSIKVLHLIVSIRDALRETKDDWIPKGQIGFSHTFTPLFCDVEFCQRSPRLNERSLKEDL